MYTFCALCTYITLHVHLCFVFVINLYKKQIKVPHYTQTYFLRHTSQDGDSNVLLNCLYCSIGLCNVVTQWLKYWDSELQFMSSNPPGAVVHVYGIKLSKM